MHAHFKNVGNMMWNGRGLTSIWEWDIEQLMHGGSNNCGLLGDAEDHF
jgi:hypothetical protein